MRGLPICKGRASVSTPNRRPPASATCTQPCYQKVWPHVFTEFNAWKKICSHRLSCWAIGQGCQLVHALPCALPQPFHLRVCISTLCPLLCLWQQGHLVPSPKSLSGTTLCLSSPLLLAYISPPVAMGPGALADPPQADPALARHCNCWGG